MGEIISQWIGTSSAPWFKHTNYIKISKSGNSVLSTTTRTSLFAVLDQEYNNDMCLFTKCKKHLTRQPFKMMSYENSLYAILFFALLYFLRFLFRKGYFKYEIKIKMFILHS